jgi:hypothetical protein
MHMDPSSAHLADRLQQEARDIRRAEIAFVIVLLAALLFTVIPVLTHLSSLPLGLIENTITRAAAR